jgi:putative N6-adenine-specific DNA methylase
VVAKELTQLGEQPRAEEGGVSWQGDARSLMRANLWLRAASRVIVRVAEFRATAFHELEKQANRVDWGAWLGDSVSPEFRVTAKKSKLYHSDAIAERLMRASHPERSEGSVRADPSGGALGMTTQLFVVRMHRDLCTISADTSGELLHMRGYRLAVGKAPLRETIAAAMLLANDWAGDEALLDPMCGSGTIPIEGAMIARNIAPGLTRDFAFMRWPSYHAPAWKSLVADAKSAQRRAGAAVRGSDRDAGAIEASRANAERAGVASDVTFGVAALSSVEPPAPSGLVATNPPYGRRVSEGKDVRNLYAQIGKLMRGKLANWRLTLLSPEDRLASQLQLPLQPLLQTSNGGIRVKLFGSARFLQSESRG